MDDDDKGNNAANNHKTIVIIFFRLSAKMHVFESTRTNVCAAAANGKPGRFLFSCVHTVHSSVANDGKHHHHCGFAVAAAATDALWILFFLLFSLVCFFSVILHFSISPDKLPVPVVVVLLLLLLLPYCYVQFTFSTLCSRNTLCVVKM